MAIVDAYDNPRVAGDLAVYRSAFGLGTAHFYKFNLDGQQGSYPSGDRGWGLEEDLDVEMVAATCPLCTIYLIQANSSDSSDLEAAEAEAVTLGAHIVSNSWRNLPGSINQSYFDTPGVTYLASAGDNGYNVGDPMDFDTVVAVGGTRLVKVATGSRGWKETAWGCERRQGCALGAGSGCSADPKPALATRPGLLVPNR